MRGKLSGDAPMTYSDSAMHVDEDEFYMISLSNQLWIENIYSWINNSEEKEKIVETSVISIWESKRAKLGNFQQMALQFSALYGTELKSFLKRVPYPPCWMAFNVMETLQIILKNLDIIKRSNEIDTRADLVPLQIPEWICRPISAEYRAMPINEYIDDFERLVSARQVPEDIDCQCPLCSMLMR